MPFCASCGSQVDGGFCVKCGTPVSAGAGPSAQQPQAGNAAVGSGLDENVASALCYVLGFLTGILFLVLAPYNTNRNIRFHAFQSIFMNIALIPIWIALWIVQIGLHAVPILGLLVSILLGLGYLLLVFCLWLYMMYKAYNNQKVMLPVIGAIAEKQAGV